MDCTIIMQILASENAQVSSPNSAVQAVECHASCAHQLCDIESKHTPRLRLYMTTKLRNPHYAPEVSVKVSLLNFFVTPEGLEDQLLGTVVTQERPDLANLKNALVVSNARMKAELVGVEERILALLSAASGNILEDETLIDTLAQAKVRAWVIGEDRVC